MAGWGAMPDGRCRPARPALIPSQGARQTDVGGGRLQKARSRNQAIFWTQIGTSSSVEVIASSFLWRQSYDGESRGVLRYDCFRDQGNVNPRTAPALSTRALDVAGLACKARLQRKEGGGGANGRDHCRGAPTAARCSPTATSWRSWSSVGGG